MGCRSCPYIEQEVKRMVSEYYQYLGAYLPENEISEWLAKQRWCDKVGGKISHFGRCSEAYSDVPKQINRFKQKRRNKRERDQKHKDHFENLWNAKKHKWFSPVLYVDYIYINHEIFNREVPYYKRLTPNHGGRYQRYCKKQANRHVRRYTGDISNGGNYKKVYEYKWSIH